MLYEIYFVNHYYFSIINEIFSLMSQFQHAPTTAIDLQQPLSIANCPTLPSDMNTINLGQSHPSILWGSALPWWLQVANRVSNGHSNFQT